MAPEHSLRLKVMLLTSSLHYGGAERQVVELAKHLDRRRFDPLVCCLDGTRTLFDLNPSPTPSVMATRRPGRGPGAARDPRGRAGGRAVCELQAAEEPRHVLPRRQAHPRSVSRGALPIGKLRALAAVERRRQPAVSGIATETAVRASA